MRRWEVTLTPDEVEFCEAEHKAIGEYYGSYDAPTYTGVNVEHGFFVGRCGEIAVRKWCKEFGIVSTWTASEHVPDEHDFAIQLDHGPLLTVDVKNSHHDRALFMMVPFNQFQRHHHDAYIGCTGRAVGDNIIVLIHGIVSRRVLKQNGHLSDRKCLTLEYPLKHLTPLDPHMFQQLQKDRCHANS